MEPEVAKTLAVHRRPWWWPWRCGRRLPCPARVVALDELQLLAAGLAITAGVDTAVALPRLES